MTLVHRLGAAVAALALVAGLSACSSGVDSQQAPPQGQDLWGDPYGNFVPADVPLEATTGGTVDLSTQSPAPLTLVFFGYTHCGDYCPIVMSTLAATMKKLSDDDRSKVKVVFITTDPARDTTGVLQSWLARYDPSFVGLTGSIGDIVKVGTALHMYVAQGAKLGTGGYDLSAHDTHITGIVDHQATTVWSEDVAPAHLAYDIHRLLHQ